MNSSLFSSFAKIGWIEADRGLHNMHMAPEDPLVKHGPWKQTLDVKNGNEAPRRTCWPDGRILLAGRSSRSKNLEDEDYQENEGDYTALDDDDEKGGSRP